MRDSMMPVSCCLMLLLSAGTSLADITPDAPPAVTTDATAAAGSQVKVLQALAMEVIGKVSWSGDGGTIWQAMKVDDVLPAGAMIQTGLRSSAGLRVGRNATILVRPLASVSLPEVVEEGSTLRTRVAIKRGQADIKVDQAGLTNDFEVITPTSVISVRGTEYSARYGAFEGTSINSADSNRIRAIEVRYMARATTHMMDGNTQSSDIHQDPAFKAIVASTGPVPLPGTLVESGRLGDLIEHGFGHDLFVNQTQNIQQAPQPGVLFSAFASQQQIDQFLTVLPPIGGPGQPGGPGGGPVPGQPGVIAPNQPPGLPIGIIRKYGKFF